MKVKIDLDEYMVEEEGTGVSYGLVASEVLMITLTLNQALTRHILDRKKGGVNK